MEEVEKNMKHCMECQKQLGIIEGYRHPTMGREYLLCSKCFDTVFESAEKYKEFISPYIGFFKKETSTISNIQNFGAHITKNINKIYNKVSKLWTHKIHNNPHETLSSIN